MRLSPLRTSALWSLIGLSTAQSSQSTWAQTQPFSVDASTESLLSSSQQALTNVVGSSALASTTLDTTALAPVPTVTGAFSTTIPTELESTSTVESSALGFSPSGSLSGSVASESGSVSRGVSSSRASSSGTSAAVQSTAAAAPVGVGGQQKMMGVAGALAGAAGVLFV